MRVKSEIRRASVADAAAISRVILAFLTVSNAKDYSRDVERQHRLPPR